MPSKNGQKEFLIGNVPIHLGDPKGSLLSVLKKQYKVEDRSAEFFVIDTLDSASVLGSVRFKQDQVVGATRQWGDVIAPSDALMSFFQNIYGAFDSASSEKQIGVLTCKTLRKPDGIYTMVLLDFGGRSADLYLERNIEGKQWLTVEESLLQQ